MFLSIIIPIILRTYMFMLWLSHLHILQTALSSGGATLSLKFSILSGLRYNGLTKAIEQNILIINKYSD